MRHPFPFSHHVHLHCMPCVQSVLRVRITHMSCSADVGTVGLRDSDAAEIWVGDERLGKAFDAWFLWDLSDKIQNKSILGRHAKPAATKVGLGSGL